MRVVKNMEIWKDRRGDKEWQPEKSWKHDGSCQPSCGHTRRQIRPKMVLVMMAIQMVIGEKERMDQQFVL